MTDALRSFRADNPSPMTLDGTCTYLVGRSRAVLIDPGPADRAHVEAIVAALQDAATLAILLTHRHADHAAGADLIRARTGAPVFAGSVPRRQDAGPVTIDRNLTDGETFETDAGAVSALATPGHSPDHFAFLWRGADAPRPGGAVFAGDLLLGEGNTALVAAPEGEVAAYLDSLESILKLRPTIVYPAHGPPITDPDRTIDSYRRHRLERVRQALEALQSFGTARADQLVNDVYGAGLDPRIRWAAEASLQATLEYLAGEGRVMRNEDGTYVFMPQPANMDR